jgi:hypothetical protein
MLPWPIDRPLHISFIARPFASPGTAQTRAANDAVNLLFHGPKGCRQDSPSHERRRLAVKIERHVDRGVSISLGKSAAKTTIQTQRPEVPKSIGGIGSGVSLQGSRVPDDRDRRA